jgi:thiol-disulfide isomerase/thioredoxin
VRLVQLITAAALLSAAVAPHALEIEPCSAAAMAEARKADTPVALHFRADWCPTCRAQDKLFDAMKAEPGLDITVLAVNHDTEKDLEKHSPSAASPRWWQRPVPRAAASCAPATGSWRASSALGAALPCCKAAWASPSSPAPTSGARRVSWPGCLMPG